MSVRWSEHAKDCLRQQARYIAEQSQSAEIAWRWMNEVLEEVDRLGDFPHMGHSLSEFPNTPYLEILARKYFRVIYRLEHDDCLIVAVRRCSMLMDETAIKEME